MLVTIVPRFVLSLTLDDRSLPRGEQSWGATHVVLPEQGLGRRFRHILTGEVIHAEPVLRAAALFRTSPVAIVWADAALA
jgi:maltooligosyltrehalose synthase